MNENEEASYVYSDIMLEGDESKLVKKNIIFLNNYFSISYLIVFFIRKKLWFDYGGYDEEMKSGYEDWEFNIRLGSFGRFGKRLNKPFFHYNVSNNGMLLSKTSKNHSRIWKYIIAKNENLFQLKNIFKLWKKWRFRPSNYPLIILFGLFFFLKVFAR